jgi:hypothetical protein
MRFRFVMNDAYFREFHDQMVATRLPRWRLHRTVARASLVTAAATTVWTLASGRADTLALALVSGLVGGALTLRLHQRRRRWLGYQRRLPVFGATVTVELSGGQLVQSSDRATDVQAIRRGEVLQSPNGWFVTYDTVHLGTTPDDEAVSTRHASAYLPRSSLQSPATDDEVAAAFAPAFTVRRLGEA